MSSSLNVIALVSGGKDSFYSILHCRRNGHTIVALGNLEPPPVATSSSYSSGNELPSAVAVIPQSEEKDLNSWMYQTVGHTIIPLYAEALGLPLYRQTIRGTAVNGNLEYHPPADNSSGQDETEDLVTLLHKIMTAHPEANAISTGAILSTYQRTRVESVALRLKLTPLSYLWQYPYLPPHVPSSLLQDMQAAEMDCRIIKVASGGLDEDFLWVNAASVKGMTRIERAVARFGSVGDGAVLGEGGEFETLVIDGPLELFKGRIVVKDEDMRVIKEGGGSAWLSFRDAKVESKAKVQTEGISSVRIPDLLEQRFFDVLETLRATERETATLSLEALSIQGADENARQTASLPYKFASYYKGLQWVVATTAYNSAIEAEAQNVTTQILEALSSQGLHPTDIMFTTILLRTMSDFATINQIYGRLFQQPNPPSRVTIACGSALPAGQSLVILLKLRPALYSSPRSKALHVQSRSYWAPANIGPYSQAQSVKITSETDDAECFIAGQIPLVPSSMEFPALQRGAPDFTSGDSISSSLYDFQNCAVLSLQHLHRVGVEMGVQYFLGSVAYVPRSALVPIQSRSTVALNAWKAIYGRPDTSSDADEDESMEDADAERDLWEERYHGTLTNYSAAFQSRSRAGIPDWSRIMSPPNHIPPMFCAEVEELPRSASIEWQAILGLSGEELRVSMYEDIEQQAVMHVCEVGRVKYAVVLYGADKAYQNFPSNKLDLSTQRYQGDLMQATMAWVNVKNGMCRQLLEQWTLNAVVPCYSLIDADRGPLAAVVVYKN